MKKLISLSLVLIMLASLFSGCGKQAGDFKSPLSNEEEHPNSAMSITVINVETGISIYDLQETRMLPIGSLAHIMTAMVVGDMADDLNAKIGSNPDTFKGIENKDLPNIDMAPNEKYPINELLKAMIIGDAYDAANLLAQHFGEGSIDKFVEMMNAKAEEIGLKDTFFKHPSGLPGTGQHTTAKDMAIMTKYFKEKYEFIFEYCSMTEFKTTADVNQREFEVKSNNPLINTELFGGQYMMTSAKGVKYSNTVQDNEYDNLVVYAEENGDSYIGVFMGAPQTKPVVKQPVYSAERAKEEKEKKEGKKPEKDKKDEEDKEGEETPEETPPVQEATSSPIFDDARYYIGYGFQNFKRVPWTADSKFLKEIPMTGEGFTRDRIQVNPVSKPQDVENIKELFCEMPKEFTTEVKKGDHIGRAYFVGATESVPVDLVTLQGSNSQPIGKYLKVPLQILAVLLVLVFAFMCFVRFRNQAIMKKRKMNAARRSAIDGKTAAHPYKKPQEPGYVNKNPVSVQNQKAGRIPKQAGTPPPRKNSGIPGVPGAPHQQPPRKRPPNK